MRQSRTKQLTVLAMLSAVAYLVMALIHFPVVSLLGFTLEYEPKMIVITIAGFLYGPISAFAVSAVVCLVEMITVSASGWIGAVMNLLACAAFSCTAAFVYKRSRNLAGAVAGLVLGIIMLTAVMLLWNYLLTPIYLNMPRDAVVPLLVPAILPFNLIKGGINAAVIMLIYKPVTVALRKSGLMPAPENAPKSKANIGIILVSVFVLVTCVLFVLVLQKIL